ncbi:MAG: hypothetical protein IKF38_03730 [Clostridia bacterium]|nr:hypothetical protein [Clostridia bacterium]
MAENNFNEIAKNLSTALIDDFRGFLVEGKERIEVPEDKLHLQIAFQEMSKDPNWEYISGTGQNPTIEYMKDKRAIYITKIRTGKNKDDFQRTVGYIKDVFSGKVEYKGKKKTEYEVLREIALAMGYDVDEYKLLERTENSVKTPVSMVNYKGEIKVKRSRRITVEPTRKLSRGDKPVFDKNNHIIGFISNGKFTSISNYKRYANAFKEKDEKGEEK